jgi:predicted SprT family Zn-dependent metalloprotease
MHMGLTMFNADRIAQVRKKVADVLYRAEQLYGLDMSQVRVRLDLRGRSAGQAGCRRTWGGGTSDHYVRLNVDMIDSAGFDHIYNETIPHEIAHVVCYMNPSLGDNHNAGWRRVCQALGGKGARCHEQEVVFANGNTYTYITTTGHKVNMSQQRHRKIQQGVVYQVRGKGMINNRCDWDRYMVAAETVAAPAAPKTVEQTPATGTKASQVRSIIALGKTTGKDQAAVVAAVVEALNMKKAMAAVYVKNNWDRV